MVDLHATLVAKVTARLDRAVAAQQPMAGIPISVWEDGFHNVRAGLEAEIEAYCHADLERLERHAPVLFNVDGAPGYAYLCRNCFGHPAWPCPEVRAIAAVYGVEVDQ